MLALLLPMLTPIFDKLIGLIPDPAAAEKARDEAMAQIISAAQAATLTWGASLNVWVVG